MDVPISRVITLNNGVCLNPGLSTLGLFRSVRPLQTCLVMGRRVNDTGGIPCM